MKDPKECEKLLRLTDAMIQVQGIILIQQGIKLLVWNDFNGERVIEELNSLRESVKNEVGCDLFESLNKDISTFE